VPLDARGLQYELYFDQGHHESSVAGYTSANTDQLSVAQTQELLLRLPPIQRQLRQAGFAP
jgi:UDP-glucose 4-epimerase